MSVRPETYDTKTFRVKFLDEAKVAMFEFKPGQFMEVSVQGAGEAPISMSSSPSRKGFLEFTIRKMGKVTSAVYGLKKGDTIYLRGPYGKPFPVNDFRGKNLYFIGGGIGLAPLRGFISLVFDRRDDYKHVKILYGARSPDDLCFRDELERWKEMPDTEVLVTVDRGDERWTGHVGVVTTLWECTEMDPTNAAAIVCGPPIMIKFVAQKFVQSGFGSGNIFMSLERYMKCGIGKCGHCNIGDKFVCIDGPVFTYKQVQKFPATERVF